ncbi:MAG: hypothetical protein ACI9Y8_002003 [Candidatus Omnitrophota bacterium]|jgi:hypothetical protein
MFGLSRRRNSLNSQRQRPMLKNISTKDLEKGNETSVNRTQASMGRHDPLKEGFCLMNNKADLNMMT